MSDPFERLRDEGLAKLRLGEFDEADRLFAEGLACAPDEAGETLMQIYRAGVAVFQRRPSPLIDALPRYLMRRDSPRHVWVAAYYLVMHHTMGRRLPEASRYVPALLDAARELHDPYYSVGAFDSVSAIEMLRANYDGALEASVAALRYLDEYAGDLDTTWMRGAAENNAGYCLLALDRHAEAVAYFERSKAVLARSGSDDSLVDVDINLALAYVTLGRLDEAEACLSHAEERITPQRDRSRRYLLYLRGEIAQRRGDVDAALRHFSGLRVYYPDVVDLEDLLLMIDVSPLLLPDP